MAERREDDRAPITLKVDYKRMNSFFADYTKNISKGGTFIRTTKPLELGTELEFVLSLPDDKRVALRGVVKWIVDESAATEEKPAGMGIQFVFEDDAKRAEVEAYVGGLMREALGDELTAKLLGNDDG